MKKVTSLNIDSYILDESKRRFFNVSDAVEKLLRDRLDEPSPQETEVLFCSVCNRELKKANNTNSTEPDVLTWLCPDEIWICNRCLRYRYQNIYVID